MPKSHADKAVDLLNRWAIVAAHDKSNAGGYGIKITPSGRYMNLAGTRIGRDAAIEMLAVQLATEAEAISRQPRRTNSSWDRLNLATKEFFLSLCETIQAVTGDASMHQPVRVEQCKIGLANAPRLSNLKKAGLVQTTIGSKKSQRFLVLTKEGRAVWAARN